MSNTTIILLAVAALTVIALLWLVLGRGKGGSVATVSDVEAPEPRPLGEVARSVAASPPPPPVVPVATQGVLPGTLQENTAPEPTPEAPPVETAIGSDNLAAMKGVGPKIVSLLHAEGITRFAQIAAWTEADIDAIDTRMGSFRGRIRRDNWVDQARFLAAGDRAGYEAKYGKL